MVRELVVGGINDGNHYRAWQNTMQKSDEEIYTWIANNLRSD